MTNKKPGYQFTIFDQISNNEKQSSEKFQQAIQDLNKQMAEKQKEINSLRSSDPDDKDYETRNEINAIERELRFLRDQDDNLMEKYKHK